MSKSYLIAKKKFVPGRVFLVTDGLFFWYANTGEDLQYKDRLDISRWGEIVIFIEFNFNYLKFFHSNFGEVITNFHAMNYFDEIQT